MQKAYFLRLFAYTEWANSRVLNLFWEHPDEAVRARRLFAHLLAGERVWLTRLRGEDSSALPLHPDWPLAECAEAAEENVKGFRRLLAELDDDLERPISYANSRGETYTTPVRDILHHVALHGVYHRGQLGVQLALAWRDAGWQPVNTDLITYVRQTA